METAEKARIALVRVISAGDEPNGIQPADCGPWASTVQEIYDAYAQGGTAQARVVYGALSVAEKGLAALMAQGRPPEDDADRLARLAGLAVNDSSCVALPDAAQLDPALAVGASPWLDTYESFARYVSPESYHGYHVPTGLWVLSVTAARRVTLALGVKRFYPSLMVALTGQTTKYSKSGALAVGLGLLESAGLHHLLHADSATPQAMLQSMTAMTAPSYARANEETQDATRRRLAFAGQRGWAYDEAGQLLDGMARPNGPMADFSGMLRRMDDNRDSFESATIARGTETVIKPYMPLLLGLTPADLKPHARKGASPWQNGLYARMAFVCPPQGEPGINARFPSHETPFPPALVNPIRNWHYHLGIPEVEVTERLNEKGKPTGEYAVTVGTLPSHVCTLAPAAEDAFYGYHRALKTLHDDVSDDLHGSYGRFAEKAMRIAMLLSSLENDGRIELRHWAKAQQITEGWRQSLHHLVDQLATSTEPSREHDTEAKVIRLLERGVPMTAREVAQLAHISSAEAKNVLDALERQGEVNAEKIGRATRYTSVAKRSVASVAKGHKVATLRETPTPTATPTATPLPDSTVTTRKDGTELRTLVLTPDWQEIPNGWAIPPGAETKVDMAEGLNHARLAQPATPPPTHDDRPDAPTRTKPAFSTENRAFNGPPRWCVVNVWRSIVSEHASEELANADAQARTAAAARAARLERA